MGGCVSKTNAVEANDSPLKKGKGNRQEEEWHMVNQYKIFGHDIGVGAYGHVRKAIDTSTLFF